MNRIASVMAMHARDRVTWFVIPAGVLGAGFAICLCIALAVTLLFGVNGIYTGAVFAIYMVILVEGIGAVSRMFPFAVGFGVRRRDYVLGTVGMALAVSAAWAVALGVFSFIEARIIRNWGVGLHFFHLPVFSDGSLVRQLCWAHDADCELADPGYVSGASSLTQLWFYFALLLFAFLLGLMIGSVYVRYRRAGVYVFAGIVFLLLSVFVLLSAYWNWWGAIFDWLSQQTVAAIGLWLLLPTAFFALVSYALLRRATV